MKRNSCHHMGVVVDTKLRDNGWKYLEVQWISFGDKPIPLVNRTEWLRHDYLAVINPLEEMKRCQDVMTLSSALLSENYERVLRKEYEID